MKLSHYDNEKDLIQAKDISDYYDKHRIGIEKDIKRGEMTPLRTDILKLWKKGVRNKALIAKLLSCSVEHVKRTIEQRNNKTKDPRREMEVVVKCKCPTCGIYHDVEMTAQPNIMPRVYCKDHEYLRYKPEGAIYGIGYGDSTDRGDKCNDGRREV